jgi:hypothetical protein
MPVNDIRSTRTQLTADRRLDKADAEAILKAAGKSVNPEELQEIAKALVPRGQYEVATDARAFLNQNISELKELQAEAKYQNAQVAQRAKTLAAEERAILTAGKSTKSYGGSPVPEAVKTVLNGMLAAGATAYDVSELDPSIGRDEHDPTAWAVSGKWTPYPQDVSATGPLAFSYTELTPKKIADDMSTERDQKVLTGYEHKKVTTRAGKTTEWDEPKYETRRMKGTGNITETYDEVGHPEVYALGQASQGYPKYSSNFAILADGSFHAVPAMRRTPEDPNLILTNPSLARGKRMLFNGHIHMQNGVVTSIGLSGRLQKLAAEGDAKFVDPVKLLQAWGFQMSPNLKVTFEGSGDVKVDANGLIVRA